MNVEALVNINPHTKFQVPRFTHSNDMMRGQNSKTGQVTLATPT